MVFLNICKNINFKDFIIKNGNFCNFLNTKSDPNIHQNAANCTIKKNYLGRMPPNPPSKARRFAQRDTSRKRDVSPQYYPPPMFEHGFTPLTKNDHFQRLFTNSHLQNNYIKSMHLWYSQ